MRRKYDDIQKRCKILPRCCNTHFEGDEVSYTRMQKKTRTAEKGKNAGNNKING
jgi:hypothetical protein